MENNAIPDLTISDLLKGNLHLASPPNVYLEYKKVIDDPSKTAFDAGQVIEKDAALAAKLLKIVNSAFYGFPSQIASIARATALVGTRELQNLLLSALVIERFSNLPGQTFSMHDFWARNLRCALLTREFDTQLGKKYAEVAFLCGLLHNIGQLLIYLRIPILAREVELQLKSKVKLEVIDEVLTEQRIIGFDHFQVGSELCRLWKLPEVMVETIRLHAYPDTINPYADIAAMVRLAHYYSDVEQPFDTVIAGSLNLPAEHINLSVEKSNVEFEGIFKMFYSAK
jgi:HD-like signal output (HDOD) protein